MSVVVDMQADVKLPSLNILTSICTLLQSLLSLDTVAKDHSDASCLREKVAEQVCLLYLLLNQASHILFCSSFFLCGHYFRR